MLGNFFEYHDPGKILASLGAVLKIGFPFDKATLLAFVTKMETILPRLCEVRDFGFASLESSSLVAPVFSNQSFPVYKRCVYAHGFAAHLTNGGIVVLLIPFAEDEKGEYRILMSGRNLATAADQFMRICMHAINIAHPDIQKSDAVSKMSWGLVEDTFEPTPFKFTGKEAKETIKFRFFYGLRGWFRL